MRIEPYTDWGERIDSACKEQSISLRELAGLCKVEPSQLRYWMEGHGRPPDTVMNALALELVLDTQQLWNLFDNPSDFPDLPPAH